MKKRRRTNEAPIGTVQVLSQSGEELIPIRYVSWAWNFYLSMEMTLIIHNRRSGPSLSLITVIYYFAPNAIMISIACTLSMHDVPCWYMIHSLTLRILIILIGRGLCKTQTSTRSTILRGSIDHDIRARFGLWRSCLALHQSLCRASKRFAVKVRTGFGGALYL